MNLKIIIGILGIIIAGEIGIVTYSAIMDKTVEMPQSNQQVTNREGSQKVIPKNTIQDQQGGTGSVGGSIPAQVLDVKYSSIDSNTLKLDLYFPAETCSGKYPLIIKIHGGAFKLGDKYPTPTKFLTDNCYAVASVNYRLSGEAVFPAAVIDVKTAVRWLRANADTYNLNVNKFGALGGSAGGYFAAFLGTTGDTKEFDSGDNLTYSSAVQAVVDEFGPVNMPSLAQDRVDAKLPADAAESKYVGCDISSSICTASVKASPISYVSKGDAPFYILHGAKDKTIPIKQSQDFYAKLRAVNVPVTFTTLPTAGHGGDEFTAYEQKIVEFFNNYLRGCANGICETQAQAPRANMQNTPPVGASIKCGDGVCDAAEKANPALCSRDCSAQ